MKQFFQRVKRLEEVFFKTGEPPLSNHLGRLTAAPLALESYLPGGVDRCNLACGTRNHNMKIKLCNWAKKPLQPSPLCFQQPASATSMVRHSRLENASKSGKTLGLDQRGNEL